MTLTKAVKIRIEEILKEKNLQLYTATGKGGMSPNTVKEIMAERNANVNLRTVMQIIRSFDMKAHEFFNSALFDSYELDID